MSYQLVDSVSMTVATAVAETGPAEGRIWAVFPWDPAQGAYIGNLPTIVQGNKGGARVYAENPSLLVSARYYTKAVVLGPSGMPVALSFPAGSDAISGSYNSSQQAWIGNASEVMAPESRIMPSGEYCAWAFEFTASEIGNYTLSVELYAEAASS